MSNKSFDANLILKWEGKRYSSFLKKLERFTSRFASAGIHTKEGKNKIVKRYRSKSGKIKSSGRSYDFNIAKLAYQNEYGAQIPIKAKYRKKTNKVTGEVTYTLRKASQQGYIIFDRQGEFVAYFPVGKVITIPKRPFVGKTLNSPRASMCSNILNIMSNCLIRSTYNIDVAWKKMALEVENDIKQNILKSSPSNHWITIKAKGFNRPLIDEQNRLYMSVKSKVYKNTSASTAGEKLDKATPKILNKLRKSAERLFDGDTITFLPLEE